MKGEENTRETPHLKRHGSAKKMPQAKRFRRKSPAAVAKSDEVSSNVVPMQWEEQFKRLDPNDAVQANRIQQRRKMIQKGKNTAGYDNYIQQVPKQKRVPRSMETPATPDPTLDISNKRFQGQIRAWRVALHKYDPPEMLDTTSAPSGPDDSVVYQTPCKPSKDESAAVSSGGEDSPISIMSESSRRDLNDVFEASVAPRQYLITGASNWADDSDDDDDFL